MKTESKSEAVKDQPKRGRGGDTGNGFGKNPQNRNTDGIEKAWRWREIFIEEVEKDSERRERMKKKQSMAIAQIEKAEAGDTQAFNAIADRMEGKAPQDIGIGGLDGSSAIDINIRMV